MYNEGEDTGNKGDGTSSRRGPCLTTLKVHLPLCHVVWGRGLTMEWEWWALLELERNGVLQDLIPDVGGAGTCPGSC